MKKVFYLVIFALGALMMCLPSCTPDGPDFGRKEAYDENGAVANGEFSVSENVRVKFSRGNLHYQADKNLWYFAENQYDIIGEDNKNISDTYSGRIDLFGWGSGANPTNTSLIGGDIFADWGSNKITNGGNRANMWRTLSTSEWYYLFDVREDAARLYGTATIKTKSAQVHGLIILPDGWNATAVPFSPGMGGWSKNEYSAKEWAKLEQSGAVFLPAAGRRFITDVIGIGEDGYYWSSSMFEKDSFDIYFIADHIYWSNFSSRGSGFSVRLVKNIQ